MQTLATMFQILYPKNNAPLLPSHFTIDHFSFFYILFFSHVLHYILPYFFSHYILYLFLFHSFLSLIPLLLRDLSFLISHPFPYPLSLINSTFPNPASLSSHDISVFLTVASFRSRPCLSFFTFAFLISLLLKLEVAPNFKYNIRQRYVQGKPVSLSSHTQECCPWL